MEKKFVSEIIASIRKTELVVFCGAGISYDSGVATVAQIIPLILDKLGMNEEERNKVCNSSLPFEAFMQVLSENSKMYNFSILLEMFKQGKSNVNHILFAKLAKAGLLKIICTTNFDTLIEDAFENEALKKGIDYDVFQKEEDFGKINWQEDKILIIKIHGSITDKKNMVVVMERVAAQEYSEQRQAIINRIFSSGEHRHVLVLGYSCSDVFDLTLQIGNVGRDIQQKNVLFLEHSSPEKGGDFGKIENIVAKEDKNPFKDFKNGKRLYYETSQIIKQIWEATISDKYVYVNYINENTWKKEIEKWTDKLTKIDRHHISANILYDISEAANSIKHWEKAYQVAIKSKNVSWQGIIKGSLGNAYSNLGECQKAIEYYEQALKVAETISDDQSRGIWLGSLGLVFRNLGEYQKAIKYHEQALNIAEGIGDDKGQENQLGNLGNVYVQLSKDQDAIKYYEKALKISEKIGNIRNIENWLGGIGLVYKNLGKYQKAIYYHERALEISEKIGNIRGQVIRLGNLGITYKNLGKYQKAVEYYEQALKISEKITDVKGQAYLLGNLGVAYNNLSEYQKAIKCLEQGLEISENIGDSRGQGNWLGNLGLVYNNLGEYQEAIKCLNKSLTIFRSILREDHPFVKMAKENLGIAMKESASI